MAHHIYACERKTLARWTNRGVLYAVCRLHSLITGEDICRSSELAVAETLPGGYSEGCVTADSSRYETETELSKYIVCACACACA